jgi:hypothetical protein
MAPTVGAAGDTGATLMTTFEETAEVHPAALVTVKLWVPAASDEIVVLFPEPETAPGLMVQFPAGNPFSTTLPDETRQEGWVMTPTIGAAGVAGGVLMVMFSEATEVHPAALVTV